jgi:GNAT superfamily N-acetyltransferase
MNAGNKRKADVIVRNTRPEDFAQITNMCRRVYPTSQPWGEEQLASHYRMFPEGQFVAIDPVANQIVGMSASLVIAWEDYEVEANWSDFTDRGMFTNHDPHGHTLYGAEVMVDPTQQGRGIGKKIYAARRELTRSLQLRRIRAGARLRGYSQYKQQMSPTDYVIKVINREIGDPTLSFQIKQGFRVLGVVHDYLHSDPDSCGHAALIEWMNHRVAQRRDYAKRDPRFARRRKDKSDADQVGVG